MTEPLAALVSGLHRAGVACQPLAALAACESGRHDLCDSCQLSGPEACELEVICALVVKLVQQAHQTDNALAQRDYWKGVADRLTNVVIGRCPDGADGPRGEQRPRVNRIFEEKE